MEEGHAAMPGSPGNRRLFTGIVDCWPRIEGNLRLQRDVLLEEWKHIAREGLRPFQCPRLIVLDDGCNDPHQRAVCAVSCESIPNQVKLGGVLAGDDTSLRLVPI